jgi:murein DD-endopeptidase MepM/ murein hydrolase activator NlpD
MRRYLGILVLLLALGVLYARLGGFAPLDGERAGSEGPAAAPIGAADPARTVLVADEATAAAPTDPVAADPAPLGPTDEDAWETVTIGRGQSFYVALTGAGISHEEVMALVRAVKPHTDLRRVQRGDTFRIHRDETGRLGGFHTELDAEHYLLVSRTEDGLSTELGSYPLKRTVRGAQGEIRSSLFEALVEEDADPQLATQLSEILGWDIDFFRDLRKGDRFTLLYEEYTREGERVRDGRILAALFTNQGRDYEAYLFENELGFPAYYDGEGNSLEKQFLRAPLKYGRISSNFSYRRLHPVHKVYRPHYGVDYAAPTGTPVYATANGTVTERTRRRGNGNYVKLRHGNGYETYYLHLSRFAKGLRVGQKVKQGDLIGHVGMTGTATAPHLDYRVKKNGKWLNPRKLDLPPAEPVSSDRMAAFEVRRDELREQLEAIVAAQSRTIVLESQTTGGSDEPTGR